MYADSLGSSKEPSRFIGEVNGWKCYESTSTYMTHLVRHERKGKHMFSYDPGKVWRYAKCSEYNLTSVK